jgi:hypothetical protein
MRDAMIVRLDAKNDHREIEISHSSGFAGLRVGSGYPKKAIHDVVAKHLSDDLILLTLPRTSGPVSIS